jgi:hypothetical protein
VPFATLGGEEWVVARDDDRVELAPLLPDVRE